MQGPIVVIEMHRGFTLTKFHDGHELCAFHSDQPERAEVARMLNMSIKEMNESHDVLHSCLAQWLGLDYSPALRSAAIGKQGGDLEHREEQAVLALQAYIAAIIRNKMQ